MATTFIPAFIWYSQCQVRWLFQDLGVGLLKATGLFLFAFVVATLLALIVAVFVGLEFQAMYRQSSADA